MQTPEVVQKVLEAEGTYYTLPTVELLCHIARVIPNKTKHRQFFKLLEENIKRKQE